MGMLPKKATSLYLHWYLEFITELQENKTKNILNSYV